MTHIEVSVVVLAIFITMSNNRNRFTVVNAFVKRSVVFYLDIICVIHVILAVTASLTSWKAIKLCFFFSLDSCFVLLITTELLSHSMYVVCWSLQ